MRLRSIAKEALRRVGLQRIPPFPQPRITKQLIASLLPPAPVIVEAGAHDGGDTLGMAQMMPGALVHAFEPVPAIFARLTERTRHLSQVHCYNLALGDHAAVRPMYVSSGGTDASSSLLRPKEHLVVNPHVLFESQIEVRTVTLDDWALKQGVQKVDFFWLDMQGFEMAALRGAARLLESATAISTEVCLIEVYEGAPLYHEVRAWLGARGFEVHTVDFPYTDSGDVLFVKRGSRQRN